MRRSPLEKEKFLEGNRQRFTLILIACMFAIMAAEVSFRVLSSPYLSFLTFVGSFYLGGATVTAWVSANKSQTVNQNIHEERTAKETIEYVERTPRPRDFDTAPGFDAGRE